MQHRAAPRVLHMLLLTAILLSALPPLFAPAAALAADTPAPLSVTVVGSLQQEVGCGGDWDPSCTASGLLYDGSDDVWQGVFSLPAADFEYKAALNGGWDENYGAGAVRNGDNIPLSLQEAGSVKFFYDHKSH